ncbi:MAG TPA: HEAT repeat domain-containing protein [Planctomycetes bacterium]|nr:HEAT repeat domain-containing protein [Planctomycetota bacterium]
MRGLVVFLTLLVMILGFLVFRFPSDETRTERDTGPSVAQPDAATGNAAANRKDENPTSNASGFEEPDSVELVMGDTESQRTDPRPDSGVGPASAQRVLEQAIEEQDLEAIWQLAFDLIAGGHFSEVDRLYEQFADAFNGGDLDSPLWKSPDFYSGNLMREYSDNEIAVLGYLGHLAQLEAPGELLADLRKELFEGEAATMILGFHEGRDPQLVADWLPYYRQRIANWSGDSFRDREIILALGHIPVAESALMLTELFDWTISSQRLDVVRALGRNGTAPALDALRNIAADDPNPVLRRAASEALALLEG